MKLKIVGISEGSSTVEVQQTLNVLKTIEEKIKKDFQKELSGVESEIVIYRPKFKSEPATEKQIAVIKKSGMNPAIGLTKSEASKIIDDIFKKRDGK